MSDHEHRHLRLADSRWVWHVHEHTCGGEDVDWNGLHHHPPVEHDDLPVEALTFREGDVRQLPPQAESLRQAIVGYGLAPRQYGVPPAEDPTLLPEHLR